MNGWIAGTLVGVLAGTAGSMGLGGGSILLLYLTIFAGEQQLSAQGINLMFFIPCALVAVYLHRRAGRIALRQTLMCALFGSVGAVVGCILAGMIGADTLRPMFAVYMLLLGVRELTRRSPEVRRNNGYKIRRSRGEYAELLTRV